MWAVRACGARERARAREKERRAAERRRHRAERQHRRWYCTAEYRGRVGSRHFQSPRGFFPEGSLFVSLRATGSLLTIFLFCLPLSVRQKKCRNEETTARREVYRTPYWGKEKKSFGCKKYWKKRICYVLHISKNYCTFAMIFKKNAKKMHAGCNLLKICVSYK